MIYVCPQLITDLQILIGTLCPVANLVNVLRENFVKSVYCANVKGGVGSEGR